MSVLQYQEDAAVEMQIWNNAAFDEGESLDSITAAKDSWWSQSIESNSSSKENFNPAFHESTVSISSTPFKGKPVQPLKSKQGMIRDERNIDVEIEEVEKEIRRLSTRLEALRLEKAEKNLKAVERRARIVPAKFMEQKQSVKFEDPPPFPSSVKPKFSRRGVSLGPAEIASRARLLSKQEMMTPVSSTSNRRKSCFWKLDEIDELKVTKERGKSQSVSPRSRKTATKPQPPKKLAQTTVGPKRPVKKDDGVISLIQPKNLFKDGEKSVPNKKASTKPGRIVASRYNQTATNQSTEARKRSLPDSDKEDGNKRRASRGNGLNQKAESAVKVKKKWEIPDKVLVFKGEEGDDFSLEFQPSVSELVPAAASLPKIRTVLGRSTAMTPRDSGAAKRVADLVGKKSFFAIDENDAAESSVCLALSFEE